MNFLKQKITMKNQLLFLCIALVAIEMQSQNAIPNPDFEHWTQNSIENPMYMPFTSNHDCYRDDLPSNVKKVSPGYTGQYAIELQTVGNHLAYTLNTDPKEGNLNLWTNGIAYSEMPTGIKGHYKYNVEITDSALLIVIFRKNKAEIGNYQFKIGGIKSTFTPFEFEFTPALTQTPDSLILCLVASNIYKNENGVNGSTLTVDNVSFVGVSTQPSELNGDFEQWSNFQLPLIIDDWNSQNKDEDGLSRTNDAKQGEYALQLTTYLGEDNNVPKARPGYLTSGYWDNNCGCLKGGNSYTLTKDTLAFWYKYAPQSTDLAQVSLQFLQNGNQIGGQHLNLNASSNYQYIEMPFELGTSPDHVIIQVASSQWDNSALSYVGSTLILDNLYFKSSKVNSTPIHFKNELKWWPNPVVDKLNISNLIDPNNTINIYNSRGQLHYSEKLSNNSIDVSALSKGLYIVQISGESLNYIFKFTK